MGLKAEEESQRVPDLVPVQVHWEQHSEIALCLCFPSSDSTEEEHYFLVQWVEGTERRKQDVTRIEEKKSQREICNHGLIIIQTTPLIF